MIGIGEIKDEVLRTLRTLVPRGTVIHLDQKLIADLRLASDDASAMAIELQKKLRVKILTEEWETVATVQDVISLLARYAT